MSAYAALATETASALGSALMAVPRQLAFLGGRARRLRQFEALRHEPPPAAAPVRPPRAPLHSLLLSCGDASGESHALALLAVLRRRHPGLRAAGFGGARLAAAGMEVWEPLADWNVMGFRDVAARLPLFFRCVQRFAAALEREPPDAVVLVDYPGLNRHLLRLASRRQVPVIDYIAPQLWAWAPWRIADFRRADRLLTILPFERDWFTRHGAEAEYVGHPLGDGMAAAAAGEMPPPELDPAFSWVGLLPGSRRREIRENLPPLLAAAAVLQQRHPDVRFVLPQLRTAVWPQIQAALEHAPVPVTAAPGSYHGVLPRLRAAWVASGTALLEVAAYRVPPVLVYGLSSRLASWGHRHALAVPWIGSLNLIARASLAPEHVGLRLDPVALAADLEARLDGPAREQVLERIDHLSPHFARPGACQRAALAIEDTVAVRRPTERVAQ